MIRACDIRELEKTLRETTKMHRANLRTLFSCAFAAFAATALAPQVASADPGGLTGTWKGGGSVSFSSGSRERARCRATFSPTSKTSYEYSATCATQSGTASASGHVRGNGTNFRGSFYNAEFDANGTISITVSGRSQTVRLHSSKGSALLRLSR
jgi:hypothetical protein